MNQGHSSSRLKETLGHEKMKQHVGDLMRNKAFLKDIKKLKRMEKLERSNEYTKDIGDQFNDLWREYVRIEKEFRRLNKKLQSASNKIYKKIAICHGLDHDIIKDICINNTFGTKDDLPLGNDADFCQVNTNDDAYDHVNWPAPPISVDFRKQSHIEAYPLRIDIHQLATKRVVLDFVNKRWSLIEEVLRDLNEKKPRFRTRKISREITDFIWKNVNLGSKALKKALDTEFPKNGITYNEILKLIHIERARRNKKLT